MTDFNNSLTNASELERCYNSCFPELRKHFLKQWIRFTGNTRTTFYSRMKNPYEKDLMLFEWVTGSKVFYDPSSVAAFASSEQLVDRGLKKFELSKKQIEQIEYQNFM